MEKIVAVKEEDVVLEASYIIVPPYLEDDAIALVNLPKKYNKNREHKILLEKAKEIRKLGNKLLNEKSKNVSTGRILAKEFEGISWHDERITQLPVNVQIDILRERGKEKDMKLWLLRPVEKLPNDDNPWEPWYDKAFGFVVRAKTEKDAREFAHKKAGDENRGEFLGNKNANTREPWKDKKYSTCIELTKNGELGVIIQDFASA